MIQSHPMRQNADDSTNGHALLDRIKRAQSVAELDGLLIEGRGFESVSRRTLAKWRIHARKRREELRKR